VPRTDAKRPRVVVVRGHQANPWELRPWELLGDRFDVTYLRSKRNWFDTEQIALPRQEIGSLRDYLPRGKLGDLAIRAPGDRYLGLEARLRGAHIVHAQELGYWYSAQAARLKERLGFKLVLTVWETLPFLDSYRNIRTRAYRRATLAQADLFLAATERARLALLLESADEARIRVAPPGVDLDRFRAPDEPATGEGPILSLGRLVWEKGHQELLRALALLRRKGIDRRALIVGAGPEEGRLRRHAAELGIGDAVEIRRFVPYDEVPALLARASCLVLASMPTWYWEEQFGMVLAEATAAGLPIICTATGAIPEVAGPEAAYVPAGDWVGLAEALAEPKGPSQPQRERASRFSAEAAAERLAAAYDELLG